VFVVAEAIRRPVQGTPEIHGLPVIIIISAIATLVMVAGVLVLGVGDGREDLHRRSVLLDTAGYAAASAAGSGAVIYLSDHFFCGWTLSSA